MSELCLWAASVILQASGATKDDLCDTQAVIAPASSTTNASGQTPVRSPLNQHSPSTQVAVEFSHQDSQRAQTRPRSGSQLFHQRWAALQAGQTYTRLPTHSFESQWQHVVHQPTYQDWMTLLAQEAQSMAIGQGNNPLTVIVGDSLSLWMPTELMPRHRFWLNQSISGETAAAMVKRLHAFDHTHPDVIHVMAGINDLKNGATDAEVLHSLRLIMRYLRNQHPRATVMIHSILPTRLPNLPSDRIRLINTYLGQVAHQEGVEFLDLQQHFTDPYGHLSQNLTTDGLHLNYRGYTVWQSLMHQVQ
ncbi:MAG: lysophospholipase [Merismopedia sp. SIO2A8]|nr:lysophospholipase [Merismopedia sp. SIO2A8]